MSPSIGTSLDHAVIDQAGDGEALAALELNFRFRPACGYAGITPEMVRELEKSRLSLGRP